MGHPLQIDLTQMSDEEFHKKQSELMSRLNSAYRMGMSDVVYQLQMILEDYQNELARRNTVYLEKLAEKSKDPKFKDSIDIS